MSRSVPMWVAFAFWRALAWLLVVRCWVRGGDHRGLRRALNQQLEIVRRFGVRR